MKEREYLFKSFEYDTPRAEFCCQQGFQFYKKRDYRGALFWYKLATELERPTDSWGFIRSNGSDRRATGPPGPTVTPAYGYAVRLATANILYSSINPIVLDTPGPLNDVLFVSNGLQVLRTGTYHVQFAVTSNLTSTAGDIAFVQLAIQVTGSVTIFQQVINIGSSTGYRISAAAFFRYIKFKCERYRSNCSD